MLLFFLHFFSCIKSNFDMWHIYNIDLRYITIGQLPHPLIGSSANHKKNEIRCSFFSYFLQVCFSIMQSTSSLKKHFPIIYVVIFFYSWKVLSSSYSSISLNVLIAYIYTYILFYFFPGAYSLKWPIFLWCSLYMYTYVVYTYIIYIHIFLLCLLFQCC